MRLVFATTFPEFFRSASSVSIMGRAIEAGLVEFCSVNIRDYATDRHKTTDDSPYGGGAGMLMKAEPILTMLGSLGLQDNARVVLTTPAGDRFNQDIAHDLSHSPEIVFICGRYEGVDERVSMACTDWLSLGDFIMTGGEFSALAMADSITRLIPGVLGKSESLETETFNEKLVEYPQYTRPAEISEFKVPDVLRSGNHEHIDNWRRKQSLRRTLLMRPDLIKNAQLNDADRKIIQEIQLEINEII